MKENSVRYAIVDLETTGSGIHRNRITEVCILILENGELTDRFVSLVNPGTDIPGYITKLTGIDDQMVESAPCFGDIAEMVFQVLQDTIFVAHNVSFDYTVLREEFRRVGINFQSKKLCTVRLTRKLIPGMYSYSLGNLCSSLQIPIRDRHRAEGDAQATVILFKKLLELDSDGSVFSQFLNPRSKQSTLPPHLSPKTIDALPETAGVYFFNDRKGKVIYVGKAINIKKRVLGHFYTKKNSEYHLGQETYSITYESTGNELIALLREAHYIQKLYPKYNKAQKKTQVPYQIIGYENRQGILQLAFARTTATHNSLFTAFDLSQATRIVSLYCEKYKLCPRFCGLQPNVKECSHYKIVQCNGICRGEESVATYNERVQQAMNGIRTHHMDFVIQEKGRSEEEQAFVVVRNGQYQGYGFVSEEEQVRSAEELKHFLQVQRHTFHTQRIIASYLKKKGERNVIYWNAMSD